MFCNHCGHQVGPSDIYCTHCGHKLTPAQPNNRYMVRDRYVALFLCLFLGVFGAHKFYEGKIIMGIIYLCTCGLFFCGCIADLLTYISGPRYYVVGY